MKPYKGLRLSPGRKETLIVKKGITPHKNHKQVWRIFVKIKHSWIFPARSPLWRTLAPGQCHLKGWWKAQLAEAASGSSWGQSSARRTWCSGSPAKSSKKRQTRLWWRRKSGKYMRTSSPFFPQKRWGLKKDKSRRDGAKFRDKFIRKVISQPTGKESCNNRGVSLSDTLFLL